MSREVTKEDIDKVLESPYWPQELESGRPYCRTHDDCDGDRSQQVVVTLSEDGDAWLAVTGERGSRRFRTWHGGGMSLRVRRALLLLAVAIKRDNEERPQDFIG